MLDILEKWPVECFATTTISLADAFQVTEWNHFLADLDCQQAEFQLGPGVQRNFFLVIIFFFIWWGQNGSKA